MSGLAMELLGVVAGESMRVAVVLLVLVGCAEEDCRRPDPDEDCGKVREDGGADMATKKTEGLLTDEERAVIPERRAAYRRRAGIVQGAVEAAEKGSHMGDRVELVRRYVAGVAHEVEVLMAEHPDKWVELERELDGPSDALGKAAADYASGGALGDFLAWLDAYSTELRRIAQGFAPRSSND